MDAATRRNLEITQTLRGEPAPTLLSLLDTCATNMGSRLLHHRLHHPLRDRTTLNARLDAVDKLLLPSPASGRGAGGEGYRTVHEQLKPCVDVERITARIALRSARPRDLSGLRDTLLTLPQLQTALVGRVSTRHDNNDVGINPDLQNQPLIVALADALQANVQLVSTLQTSLKPEPSSVLREGGVIADGFDPELDELRGIQTNCGDFLLALEVARTRAQRHRHAQSGIQPRAWFLHRGDARAERQRAGRLPPPPDAEERRTLHHAGTESLRGQGTVRQRARAGSREISLRTTARPALRRTLLHCSVSPQRSPNSTCSPRLPNAPPR